MIRCWVQEYSRCGMHHGKGMLHESICKACTSSPWAASVCRTVNVDQLIDQLVVSHRILCTMAACDIPFGCCMLKLLATDLKPCSLLQSRREQLADLAMAIFVRDPPNDPKTLYETREHGSTKLASLGEVSRAKGSKHEVCCHACCHSHSASRTLLLSGHDTVHHAAAAGSSFAHHDLLDDALNLGVCCALSGSQ